MSASYEQPSFAALIEEQEVVQATKFQGRLLQEYNAHLFPGQLRREPVSCAVSDFVRSPDSHQPVTIESVIDDLYASNLQQPISWVDMGGGRGLALREAVCKPQLQGKLRTANVDLFDWGLTDITPEETDYLLTINQNMLDPASAPAFIHANAETVTLPQPANLITSTETIQYLHNPLAAIANWYNQLADNGLLMISARHEWSSWIRYERGDQHDPDETPIKHFLDTLQAANITYAAMATTDTPLGVRPDLDVESIRNLVIRKKPESELIPNSDVTDVWVNPHNYKAVYYRRPLIEQVSPTAAKIPKNFSLSNFVEHEN